MNSLILTAAVLLNIVPAGKASLRQLQPRDSILVADQLEYGFRLDSVRKGSFIGLPDFVSASNDTLTLVRGWKLDTLFLKGHRKEKDLFNIDASVVLAPFEEGRYLLPDIPVLRRKGRDCDTLLFEGIEMEVKTLQIDTATFVPHDIKPQIDYPLTFGEIVPWVGGVLLFAALLAFGIVYLRSRRRGGQAGHSDPPHIVALRELDRFRGDKYWAPDKQKFFYSGITDTLKAYIEGRFGVDAPEMTTAELFEALKDEKDIPEDLYLRLRSMFETADFVKFAKHAADDAENAQAVPLAVNFVTTTYEAQLSASQSEGGSE